MDNGFSFMIGDYTFIFTAKYITTLGLTQLPTWDYWGETVGA